MIFYFGWSVIGIFMTARIACSCNLFFSCLIMVPWWMDSLSSWIWLSIMKCVLFLICTLLFLTIATQVLTLTWQKNSFKKKKKSSYSLKFWGVPTLFTIWIHIYVYIISQTNTVVSEAHGSNQNFWNKTVTKPKDLSLSCFSSAACFF